MAKKKTHNGKEASELNKIIADRREELRSLRFGSAGSKNKNVKATKNLRKDIARALTALNAPAK
jgi:ribosomal protein L29